MSDRPDSPAPDSVQISPQADLEAPVDTPKNVLPFRPVGETKSPVADAGRKQRLRRARPAIVGAARQGERRTPRRPMTAESRLRSVVDPPPSAEATEPAITPPRWLGARRHRPAANPGATGTLFDLLAGRRADLPARPAALCQPRLSRADGLCQPAGARRGRRARRALCRTRRFVGAQHLGHRHAGDDIREPGRVSHAATDARLFTISWDDESALALICSNPAATAPPVRRVGRLAFARRPRQRRGTRRHPRYHRRRHPDVRCRRQHQCLQPQRRGAVRS